jgi:hypothetical protein
VLIGKYQLAQKKFGYKSFCHTLVTKRAYRIFFNFDRHFNQHNYTHYKFTAKSRWLVNFDWTSGRWADIILNKRKNSPIYRAVRIFDQVIIFRLKPFSPIDLLYCFIIITRCFFKNLTNKYYKASNKTTL